MSWNENIKEILDFIPLFKSAEQKIKEAESKFLHSSLLLNDAISSNKSLIKKIEKLEVELAEISSRKLEYDDSKLSELIKSLELKVDNIPKYDDSKLSERIELFEGRFDSFRATETSQINKSISINSRGIESLKESLSNIPDLIDGVTKKIPEKYNDEDIKMEVRNLSESLNLLSKSIPEAYDDSKIIDMIKSSGQVKPYDDSSIKEQLDLIVKKKYDDSKIKSELSIVSKAVKSLSADVSKVKSLFEV